MPGSMGQVEPTLDRARLAVYSTHKVVGGLLAIPGVQRPQMGDTEARMRFAADDQECLRAECSR